MSNVSASIARQSEAVPAVSLSGVTFSFGEVPVIECSSIQVFPQEFVSVIGPNGGGKTTLLKLILGLIEPDAGTVRVFGRSPRQARGRIGYTPQHGPYDLAFPVSVMDVVLMGRVERQWMGRYRSVDRQAAAEALEEVGMLDHARRPFSSLSGGQRQRTLIARALASKPDLLLLDEPTANVDVIAGTRLAEMLRQLSKRMTIILVSHDLGFVSTVVERVICVNREVVVHPTSDITGETIRDIYGGDLRLVRHDHRCAEEGHIHE